MATATDLAAHPIDGGKWADAYPAPRERALARHAPQDIVERLESGQKHGVDIVVVDVRRADCKVRVWWRSDSDTCRNGPLGGFVSIARSAGGGEDDPTDSGMLPTPLNTPEYASRSFPAPSTCPRTRCTSQHRHSCTCWHLSSSLCSTAIAQTAADRVRLAGTPMHCSSTSASTTTRSQREWGLSWAASWRGRRRTGWGPWRSAARGGARPMLGTRRYSCNTHIHTPHTGHCKHFRFRDGIQRRLRDLCSTDRVYYTWRA